MSVLIPAWYGFHQIFEPVPERHEGEAEEEAEGRLSKYCKPGHMRAYTSINYIFFFFIYSISPPPPSHIHTHTHKDVLNGSPMR